MQNLNAIKTRHAFISGFRAGGKGAMAPQNAKSRLFTRESSFQRLLAIAILSVSLSITRADQSKTVQAKITKSSPSAVRKTLVRNLKAFS